MTDTVRVGIIGVGWGALVHGPAYGLVDGYEVVALVGRRSDPLAVASERLGIADTATDWRSFVERDDLDVVSIVLPVDLHRPVFLAALEAGKHVVCEKPLCLTGEEGRDMVRAAEASDRHTAVCFQGRWGPERLALWELVTDGALGQPYFAQASQTAAYWHPTRPLQSEWMYRLDEGGGYLSGMASHDIDYLQTLLGRVVAVTADVRSSVPQRRREDGSVLDVDADDSSALVMRMESGALAVLSVSVVGYQAGAGLFTLLGSGGTYEKARAGTEGHGAWHRVGEEASLPLPRSERTPRSGRPVPARRAGAAIQSLALMLEDWLPAFSGQPTRVPTVRDAWRVEEVIDAARASSAGAGWVDVRAEP